MPVPANRRGFLGGAAAALATFGLLGCTTARSSVTRVAALLNTEGTMPSLGGATDWLNSPPLTTAGLRGQVVLVNFWTYTCINWLRQLPYRQRVRGLERVFEQLLAVTDQRLHQLIRQALPIGERRFEIEFDDSGVAGYAFTFG